MTKTQTNIPNRIDVIRKIHQRILAERSASIRAEEKGEKR